MDDKLPIDVDMTTNPLTFKWRQRVDTVNGVVTQDCEGPIPATIEMPVAAVIEMVKQLQKKIKELRSQIEQFSVHQQAAKLPQSTKKKG